MTQSGGNGHKPDVDAEEVTTFEPVYSPASEEPIGWIKTEGEEEEFITDLPSELDDQEPPSSN